LATRIQVILDAAERERFRRQAEREGLSLSAWLRLAGRERLGATRRRSIATRGELRAFWKERDRAEPGREPDWEEHREVIGRSLRSGSSGT